MRPMCSGPPPAARTTSSTRSSAPAHCSTSPARSGAVCPATNSTRPPAAASIPLFQPLGRPSASGLTIRNVIGIPPSAITTVSPLVSRAASSHSVSTARATSSGEISWRWPVDSSAACSAASGDIPVFAAMRATDSRVMSVST